VAGILAKGVAAAAFVIAARQLDGHRATVDLAEGDESGATGTNTSVCSHAPSLQQRIEASLILRLLVIRRRNHYRIRTDLRTRMYAI